MGVEIERKFLVDGNDWQSLTFERVLKIRQGYLTVGSSAPLAPLETRVRISECLSEDSAPTKTAVLTVKSQGDLIRQEVECPIPVQEAEELLSMCEERQLLKDRHVISIAGVVWEIDVYRGPLEGLVVAEVELPSDDTDIELPSWVGREISDEQAFKNASLATSYWTGRGAMPRLDKTTTQRTVKT